jgi:hypothetical protein
MLAPLAIAAFCFGCSDDSSDGDDTTGGTSSGGTAGTANAGTSNAGTGGGGGDAVSFATDVYPILRAKCGSSGCHDGSSAPILPGHGAADEMDAYAATQAPSTRDNVTPVYERILARASGTDQDGMMPPNFANPPCNGTIGVGGCLTQAELDIIEAWVDQGAPP